MLNDAIDYDEYVSESEALSAIESNDIIIDESINKVDEEVSPDLNKLTGLINKTALSVKSKCK